MAHALITGASKGIGKAIALELALKGYDVLLVARNESALSETCQEIMDKASVDAQSLVLDLSSDDAALRLREWVHSLHVDLRILVNNAGYGLSGRFEEQKLETIQNMMQLNMTNLVSLTHLLFPLLKRCPQA